MKTYEQLMKHYWGVIVPMAEDAGIDPWLCVRLQGQSGGTHPGFTHSPCYYTFALKVLEKTPIFPGMTVYGMKGCELKVYENINLDWRYFTLKPPTKKRTFMLNGEEYVCPSKTGKHHFRLFGDLYCFDEIHDAEKVEIAFRELLLTARDKE